MFSKYNNYLIIILIFTLVLEKTRSESENNSSELKSLIKTYIDYSAALKSDSITINYLQKQQLVNKLKQLDEKLKAYMSKDSKNVLILFKVWSQLNDERNKIIKQQQAKSTAKEKSASDRINSITGFSIFGTLIKILFPNNCFIFFLFKRDYFYYCHLRAYKFTNCMVKQ
jgi:Fe2+ transport system protein B